jgi:[glutamine synthetase] adenylyltransferase / [glutamine synthetase]-adenylyl-L-tyrosine phosphorylase
VVATNTPEFATRLEETVRAHVLKPRDNAALLKDVLDMRSRIANQFPTHNPWALKHARGGMVDLDFIAQYLVLRYAATHPTIWHRSARQVFEAAQTDGMIDSAITAPLLEAKKFLSDLMSLLRLSASGGLITDEAPVGLKNLLTHAMRMENFEALKAQVLALEANVTHAFEDMARGKW